MSPAVSVLIPTDAAGAPELQRALAGLRAQSLEDWEAVLVGPDRHSGPLARDDRRARILPARAGRAELVSQAIDAARAGFVLILDPADSLMPEALEALVAAQAEADAPGVVGDYRFVSRLGPVPQDPLAGAPDEIGWEELIRANLFPTCAVLMSRNALGFFRTGLDDAWDYDHWLRLTEAGLRLARCQRMVAAVNFRELSTPFATLDALAARVRVVKASLDRKGQGHRLAELTRDLCDAFIALRSHQQTIDRDGDGHLTTATRFPYLFAQWWQRMGFYGQPPRHVLEANGGVGEGISGSPELVASRLIDLCPVDESPILLGLGKNARQIARRLHARGVAVRGRDDSLSGPPDWAMEDGVPVEVIGRGTPFDAGATYIMTVLNDAGFLARLPRHLTIHRWAAMPELILSEWRAMILDPAMCRPRLEAAPV